MNKQRDSFIKLQKYIEKEKFKGYDPYDILNSPIPFKHLGKWPGVILTQIQKRNPLNIRPLLGVKKDISPTAFGIFLQAYSILYQKYQEPKYLELAESFYDYLKNNYTKGYSGIAWGCNFPWASSDKYIEAFVPSSVVTSFICRGLWQYYLITQKKEVADIIISAGEFIQKDLSVYEDNTGKCISYAPDMQDLCYNSSLLSCEILARAATLTENDELKKYCVDLVNFVLARQKSNGRWNYSQNIHNNEEREQIDFHQGYVLESIYEIKNLLKVQNKDWTSALVAGLDYYYENQFFKNGRSIYRWPKEFPVDIHNQSQGIITFVKLRELDGKYFDFANTIFNWTIDNMQDSQGFFYYKKYKNITDRTSYIRWSQAFMFLAQSYFLTSKDSYNLEVFK